jgi:hypothetical protein
MPRFTGLAVGVVGGVVTLLVVFVVALSLLQEVMINSENVKTIIKLLAMYFFIILIGVIIH